MDTIALIDALRADGTRLADVAKGLGIEAVIPTCPGWTVRDLLRHLGGIHRWAGTHVREARSKLVRADDLVELVGAWPADRDLVDWYRAEHALLVESLAAADPNLACAAFLPAPTPLHFWARRQAHETAIHRVDVESAAGQVSAFAPAFAADGIDELLAGFVPRPRQRLRTAEPRTLAVAPDDDPARWLIRIGSGPVVTQRVDGPADCCVSGRASDLYLALWNRAGVDTLRVDGDAALLDLFRETITIRWG